MNAPDVAARFGSGDASILSPLLPKNKEQREIPLNGTLLPPSARFLRVEFRVYRRVREDGAKISKRVKFARGGLDILAFDKIKPDCFLWQSGRYCICISENALNKPRRIDPRIFNNYAFYRSARIKEPY